MGVDGEEESHWSASRDALHQILAGSLAGTFSAIVTAPLDLARTRLQVQYVPKNIAHPNAPPLKYSGLWGTLKTTYLEEGLHGWFKGLGSSLFGLVPSWAIYFTSYNQLKRTLADVSWLQNKTQAHILSAMTAGMITAGLTNPLWVVKVRLQTQFTSPDKSPKYRSIRHAYARIIADEGIRGLFKGLPLSLMGTIHVMIQFPLYERLKVTHIPIVSDIGSTDPLKPHLLQILVASLASKWTASAITYPHEVLRTRFQRQRTIRYRSIPHAISKIIREEGIEAFYRGMGINMMRVMPTVTITFAVYEYSIHAIEKFDRSRRQ